MRVTLKLATSLDGRIATADGESRWITGHKAREEVHRLRAMHAGVLIGVETAIADDPELTVRLPGFVGFQPARVVLDSRQRLPADRKLVRDAGRLRTIVLTTREPAARLTKAGVEVVACAADDGRVDPTAALAELEKRLAFPSVMIEGGGEVAASFLSRGLVDAVEWFRAPIVLGDEGRPAVAGFVLKTLAAAPRFRPVAAEPIGEDLWERYVRA